MPVEEHRSMAKVVKRRDGDGGTKKPLSRLGYEEEDEVPEERKIAVLHDRGRAELNDGTKGTFIGDDHKGWVFVPDDGGPEIELPSRKLALFRGEEPSNQLTRLSPSIGNV